jgi:branched-chain amino acid transport system substrate-binding protein
MAREGRVGPHHNRSKPTLITKFFLERKMRNVDVFRSILVSIVLVFCLSFFAWAADPIKIGIIGPMNFTQGEGMWNGATMAADEINKAGGITVKGAKRPIEIVKLDSNEFLSVPDATNAMELGVSRYKVDFLVGGFVLRLCYPCWISPWTTRRFS